MVADSVVVEEVATSDLMKFRLSMAEMGMEESCPWMSDLLKVGENFCSIWGPETEPSSFVTPSVKVEAFLAANPSTESLTRLLASPISFCRFGLYSFFKKNIKIKV